MTKRAKAGSKRQGKGAFYLVVFLLCVVTVLFFAIKSSAGNIFFDANIAKIEEVGKDEKVTINFSQPVESLSLDNINISPFIGFSYELAQDKKGVTITPSSDFVLQQKYTITLSGIKGIAGLPIGKKELAFYTEKKDDFGKVAGETTSEQYAELELAKNRYVPPATSAVKTAIQMAPHWTEGKYIDVSISKQVMTLFENGVQVNQFKVSTGKVGMPTPLGEYKVLRKETNHWSSKYKLWMPYSMNFIGGYYIHELPYWPNGYREGESHLGKRVSHGCVRLGIGPAKYVFDWTSVGTPLYIHN